MNWNQRRRRKKTKTVIAVVAAIIVVIFGVFYYSSAYSNSAEAITITVADKWKNRHTDEDGCTTTTYLISTHGGEDFVCGTWGRNGESMFQQFRINETYEVVVAGLGITKRDVASINRHIPKPEPKPVLIRVDEPERE
jgi:hypothetical protein